jgi:hypothetical protein
VPALDRWTRAPRRASGETLEAATPRVVRELAEFL